MGEPGRQLRNVRFEQAVRAFERLGFTVDRVTGAHHVLKPPQRGMLVLPSHGGTIKVGLRLDALKTAGLEIHTFREQM